MRFYEINSDSFEDGQHHVATKGEALRIAKELDDDIASVYAVEIPDTRKETIIALANQRGWCSRREFIWGGKRYDPNYLENNRVKGPSDD